MPLNYFASFLGTVHNLFTLGGGVWCHRFAIPLALIPPMSWISSLMVCKGQTGANDASIHHPCKENRWAKLCRNLVLRGAFNLLPLIQNMAFDRAWDENRAYSFCWVTFKSMWVSYEDLKSCPAEILQVEVIKFGKRALRLTVSSTGDCCNEDVFSRSLLTKCMSYTCLADFVHPRKLHWSAGTYFPYLMQSVLRTLPLVSKFVLDNMRHWRTKHWQN